MKKNYYTHENVGKIKYLVSFHDGKTTHKDGSPFYNVRTYSNKSRMKKFITALKLNGYTERGTTQ